jgi:hypothetical protein
MSKTGPKTALFGSLRLQAHDRVRHVGMNELGTVDGVTDDSVHVTYDRIGKGGRHWEGLYDANWFRLHPTGLVKCAQITVVEPDPGVRFGRQGGTRKKIVFSNAAPS